MALEQDHSQDRATRPKGGKEWLSRKEAAAYLTDKGHPLSAQHLANLASNNNARGGPSFSRVGWCRVQYHRADLDAWAKARTRRVD